MLEDIKVDPRHKRYSNRSVATLGQVFSMSRDVKILVTVTCAALFFVLLTDSSVTRAQSGKTNVDTPAQSRQKAEEAAHCSRSSGGTNSSPSNA